VQAPIPINKFHYLPVQGHPPLQAHPAVEATQPAAFAEVGNSPACQAESNPMQVTDENSKEKLMNRLRRIEGQVRGVQVMISDERNCRDILQQLSAIRSAVQGVSLLLLEDYMSDCFVNLDDKTQQERDDLLRDLIQLLGKNS